MEHQEAISAKLALHRMTNPMRYPLLLILCAILVACKVDPDWLLQSEDILTIETHQTDGRTKGKKEIRKGEEVFSRFKKWVEENENGWEPSLASFVPYIEVRGTKFTLNFHPHLAVLNFKTPDGHWHQYVKNITEADFQYLLSR